MKTIIAPTDFSKVSLNAVNYAADMASAINAKLLLLHASESSIPGVQDFLGEATPNDINIEKRLFALERKLRTRTGDKIIINAMLVSGTIENELIKICEDENPLAVVMATHGDGTMERFFIGSITVYLSKHLQYPVLVIPKDVCFKPIHKVILASDMKSIYDLPLEKITDIVTVFNASLDVVHVCGSNEKMNKNPVEVSFLNHRLRYLNPHFHFINNDNVSEGVSLFAEKNNADMVLIFPKKHGPFHKSDSKQFIFHSTVPVMTVQLAK